MGLRGPTLHEVANLAGVSIATVSRVARGLDHVSQETRERVVAAIEELNYRPSHFGRALVKRRHDTLGIVFPGLRGPYYSEVIHGFELAAVEAEMSLLILGTELLPHADQQVLGLADRADGLAIMGTTVSEDLIRRLSSRGVPVVTMARNRIEGIPNTRVDNYSSTVALVAHLIHDHNYTRMLFVGNISGAPDATDRWAGFVRAHRDAGLTPPDAPISSAWEPVSGMQAAWQILDMPDRPQAVVCGNDEIATGMLSAFASVGVQVPDEIAVTGWDDGPYSEYTTPPLTTVAQPARALGQETARILLGMINGKGARPDEIVLSTEPILRASCGCQYRSAPPLTIASK